MLSATARTVALQRSRLATSRFALSSPCCATTRRTVSSDASTTKTGGLWQSATFWGGMGAIAGWGMSPEVISLTMTPVLIVYSSLFARWAYIVKPQNLLLCACHVTNVGAQLNQLRRALVYKMENGQQEQVEAMGKTAAVGGAIVVGSVLSGPALRGVLTRANLGIVSSIADSPAGPFTVHFWAPMSKWYVLL
jgi:hypothetical protein